MRALSCMLEGLLVVLMVFVSLFSAVAGGPRPWLRVVRLCVGFMNGTQQPSPWWK